MLSRSSRGGVPVFSRPHSKPNDLSDSASSRDGGSPARPGRPLLVADVDQAVQERAGRYDKRTAGVCVAVFHREPGDPSVLDENAPCSADEPFDVRLGLERLRAPSAP